MLLYAAIIQPMADLVWEYDVDFSDSVEMEYFYETLLAQPATTNHHKGYHDFKEAEFRLWRFPTEIGHLRTQFYNSLLKCRLLWIRITPTNRIHLK
jgi:hypothetical protein